MKFYLNKDIVEAGVYEDILEPGFLFGWGVFETLRIYSRKPAFLDEHIDRLKKGCEKIFLSLPDVDFKKEVTGLLDINNLDNAYCRITVFKKRKSTGCIIHTAPFNYYPAENYQKGVKAIISPIRRNSQHPLSGIKPVSYLDSRYSWKLAQDKGADEALFLNEEGFLAEGSRTNLFFVKGKTVFTPSLDCGILAGITRQKVIEVVKAKGYKLEEGRFLLGDLLSADEAFLTSSLMEVMPLVEADSRKISGGRPGKVSLDILSGYRNVIDQL